MTTKPIDWYMCGVQLYVPEGTTDEQIRAIDSAFNKLYGVEVTEIVNSLTKQG